MSKLDHEFIVDALTRYGKHLVDVKIAIEKNVTNYGVQKVELERIAEKYPERYLARLEDIAAKEAEAKAKLDPILKRLAKLPEQILEIQMLWE